MESFLLKVLFLFSGGAGISAMVDGKSIVSEATTDEVVAEKADVSIGQNGILPTEGASGAVETSSAGGGKWTNGIKDVVLDCPLEAAWDLVSDWGNWQMWYSLPDSQEHRAGEHRKPGCTRFVQYPEMSLYERALEIDSGIHFLKYTIDENDVFGGIKGYVAYVEFRDMGDGKTTVPYWNYEVEPVENQTPETFHALVEYILKKILEDLERGAQRLAAGLPPLPVNQAPSTADSTTRTQQ